MEDGSTGNVIGACVEDASGGNGSIEETDVRDGLPKGGFWVVGCEDLGILETTFEDDGFTRIDFGEGKFERV